ncbi:hypothetical protein CIL03_03370 [Virgibacillus indicus]|uniref:Dynamin N-terminal domain-containing protein n=1 Tax=Virgibacillus indicus TaxID=2024554 RepID=A0A265NFY5_9BACI|nr:dynamin family protein [Virgibacillus indicus]OZU90196.1 hypothetical protein CIL03_03370 [Virgibacillus indicus]
MVGLDIIQSTISLSSLAASHKLMLDNGDEKNAKKIRELYEKLDKNELMISFAGHFSAGKSSMINALTGKEILPKSPIPTSSNIVKISSGEGAARVFFYHDNPVEYKEPYDLDMIKDYSMDKDTIKRLEISTSEPIIPKGCSLVDTPGIDAADDADRLMTEASLHLVDVLFYVMDYNHVQSEVNLQFLKALQEKSIPFYVIINQIDKHDEAELTFKNFTDSIKQTFDQWKIKPEHIYYSSLMDPAAVHNQFGMIKEKLFSIMGGEKESFQNTEQSFMQIIKEHKRFLNRQYEEKLTEYGSLEAEEGNESSKIEVLETELMDLENMSSKFENEFQSELNNTLKNAYLMPSNLRERAADFLQSQQSDFKAGLFSSKKKTEEERNTRLLAFLTPLQENLETVLQWKLRDKFTRLLKDYNLSKPELQNQINELSVVYTGEDLIRLIKPGAKVTGDYVLNYTNDVSADIKNKFKKQARRLSMNIQHVITEENENQINLIREKLNQQNKHSDLMKERDTLKSILAEKSRQADELTYSPVPEESAWDLLQNAIEADRKPLTLGIEPVKIKKEKLKSKKEIKRHTNEKNITDPVSHVLESLNKTIRTIESFPGFEAIIDDLKGKHDRLKNRSHTIALFGAFSAGKSSFANALLGESVLPVSPNPTTAAVNRIAPVNGKYTHGTVVVTLKGHETLKKDLDLITKYFSKKTTDFEGLLKWIKENKIYQDDGLNKMYQAYLQAMITGYQENKDYIGSTRTIRLDEFACYVTDETKACYIESIDLYYDCSLTRQGITLVDTPGADSVNARHTNVAFDYIKHADAILYVTYYNHALSRADKDFLTQLGRVKESFELDKMFFIVNAADLAKDDKELQLVTEYVQEQLLQLGVRFPKLYPVSSKLSLANKREDQKLNKNMQLFEDHFYDFIHNELAALTVKSALWDIGRASKMMGQYIKSMNLDEEEKENYRIDLLNKRVIIEEKIDKLPVNMYEEQIKQKIEKQLFYVLERLSIRFHDLFKEAFNPTTITESGRRAQSQLLNCLGNLLDETGFDLHQELQAVSLRIESFIKSQGNEAYESLRKDAMKADESFIMKDFSFDEFETPSYTEAFRSIDTKQFEKVLATFKGTKAFFEKNEKEIMKDNLYSELKPLAKQYIEKNKSIMSDSYLEQWSILRNELKSSAIHSLETHVNNALKMISSSVDMAILKENYTVLEDILKTHKMEEASL